MILHGNGRHEYDNDDGVDSDTVDDNLMMMTVVVEVVMLMMMMMTMIMLMMMMVVVEMVMVTMLMIMVLLTMTMMMETEKMLTVITDVSNVKCNLFEVTKAVLCIHGIAMKRRQNYQKSSNLIQLILILKIKIQSIFGKTLRSG